MASPSLRSGFLTCSVCLLLVGGNGLAAETRPLQGARAPAATGPTTPERIGQYVRDRFEVPESVKVTAEPLGNSQFPIFFQTIVTTDDGKEKRASNVFITKDGRCFVMGNVFALPHGSTAEIVRCVREVMKLPPQTELKTGTFNKTSYPQFLKAVITASDGKNTQTAEIFITKDRRTGILGIVLPFREDFVRGLIKTKDVPSLGPSNAPVTVVEYADLQCPACARLHEFLEKELLPKYGDKVRVIFKEFPLPMHDWSTAAAVANECAYQINPSVFPGYRTLIFANQNAINASNVRERLLALGDEAGVERSRLAVCIDSKASLSQVEAARQEGEDLGVNKTPTTFVNGRIIVGLASQATFDKIVDEALLARTKTGKGASSPTP
ncbi:MAG: DsbA family protein [Terriglobia bacterium]|jgi:protein-disulfide isomerase